MRHSYMKVLGDKLLFSCVWSVYNNMCQLNSHCHCEDVKMSALEIILDNSYRKITSIPETILDMRNLKMLYLEGNFIETLPENFFQKLPKLSWLDLRSNKMISIPAGIANHPALENLLLQNNQIEWLPNELGLVPNLKVLQLSGNPIIYPPEHIIQNGVDDICIYLRQEYDRINRMKYTALLESEGGRVSAGNSDSETTITCDAFEEIDTSKLLRSSAVGRRIKTNHEPPVITVKSLSKQPEPKRYEYEQRNRKIHKITKSPSKLSVHSQYNSGRYVDQLEQTPYHTRIEEQHLKEVWLEKLKDLLHDQEKIIQQEKNLQALSMWRSEKKAEAPRSSSALENIPEAPYDTDPAYRTMLSRKDLHQQIDRLIAAKSKEPDNVKIEQLINDVVAQLKDMEVKLGADVSPTTQMRNAEQEIQMIMDLHKRIAEIQVANETR